jgi:hypothetical protein
MNKYPIYIPSRHRPECQTARLLEREGVDFRIVVEPHDFEIYEEEWPGKVCILPEDNKGIAYSRGWIKFSSGVKGEKFHWQLDDDVTGFLHRPLSGRSIKVPAAWALKQIEKIVDRYANIGIAGFNQNSWPPRTEITFRDLPVQGVLINNALEANYCEDLPLMSDFDFVLQVLKEGHCSVMRDTIRIITPGDHGKAGGLKEAYAQNKLRDSARILQKRWPGLKVDYKEDGKVSVHKRTYMRRFDVQPYKVKK